MAPRRTPSKKAPRTNAKKKPHLNPSTAIHRLPTLPHFLMIQILYRLPPKSLVKFKSVCRSMKNIISRPKFAKEHLRVSHTRCHVLYLGLTKAPDKYRFKARTFSSATAITTQQLEYPLKGWNLYQFHRIVGSCDEIVCIATNEESVLLWNPTIRKYFIASWRSVVPKRELLTLGGPTHTTRSYGFGKILSNDSYKVVVVTTLHYQSHIGCYDVETHVYTLGTLVWLRIGDIHGAATDGDPGIYLNGTVNFLSVLNTVLSFDLDKNSYRTLLGPGVQKIDHVCVVRDCLSIVSYTRLRNEGNTMDVWIMKEYGNEDTWNKLFSIPPLEGRYFWPRFTTIIQATENDELMIQHEDKTVVCNAREGTLTQDLKIVKFSGKTFPTVFVESLISPCY